MGSLVLDLLKTVKSTFGIGRGTLSMSGLTAARTFTYPDQSGTIPLLENAFTIVPKIADLARTNNVTLANDNHLVAALAIGTYRIQVFAVFDVASQTDVKIATAFSGTATHISTYRKSMIAAATAGTDVFTESIATGLLASTSLAGTGSGIVIVEVDAVIVVTVAGTWGFQWAQDTTGAQACTLKAGSYLQYMKVA